MANLCFETVEYDSSAYNLARYRTVHAAGPGASVGGALHL